MKLFRFDIPTANPIPHSESDKVLLTPVLERFAHSKISCMYFGAGGLLAMQMADLDRLFLVVSGRGWVKTQETDYIRLQTGQAVFWQAGEQHEILTHNGMVMMVIEGENLHPEHFLHPYVPR